MAGTARPAGTAIGAGAPEHGRPSARAGRIAAYGGGTRGPAKTLGGGRSDIGGAAYRVGQRPYRGRSRTAAAGVGRFGGATCRRQEEQTSELQSLMRNSYAVFCLTQKNRQQ